jgi:threo-3-hydroxy-L-aspartate ammonia-lyase
MPPSLPASAGARPVIGYADIEAARQRLAGIAHRTPVLTSRTLDAAVGARLFLKAENLQRIGAFKIRGAYNKVASLPPDQVAAGVAAVSSGNHAQAVALSARLHGTRAVILMPHDAPQSKRDATIGYGATVLGFDRYGDDREQLLAELCDREGLAPVHAYDDAEVMAGQGTVAVELLEQVADLGEQLDVLVVCLGGGGLLAGCATAAAQLSPATRVVGVEPAASPDWQRSLAAGQRVRVPVGRTIADGQQLDRPGALTWATATANLHHVVTVTDEQILAAMRLLFERLRVVVEPSGASALAAVLGGALAEVMPVGGLRIGVTLSGGNVDILRFAHLLAPN